MKKLFYTAAILLATGLTVTSCTDEETTNEQIFQEINPSDDGNPKGPDPCDDGEC